MNYYRPREIMDKYGNTTGKWHYTVQRDKSILPVGYCNQECPGHDTPDEAREHYKTYMLDHRLYLDKQWENTQHKCLICGAWTDRYVLVGNMTAFDLCDKHQNRENIEKLYRVGDSISSY